MKNLLEINKNEYPDGLPGKNMEYYFNAFIKHENINGKLFWAKSFYGDNNEYNAWTSGLIDDKGIIYFYCHAESYFLKTKEKIK